MKKYVALLLALCMVFALCACGNKNETAKTDDTAQATDTNTVAVGAVVIARDDVPEDEIYAFVSTIFENKDAITAQHAKGIEVASVKEGAGTGTAGALTFTTGGESGTYYAFGGVLASYVSSNTDYSVTAVTSGGSQANIEDMMSGNAQLGFVQSDVMSYAYNGERLFDQKVEGFSVVAALYMEQVQIVTTNPYIKSVADLEGKNVSIGAAGSGVYFNAIDVLGAYGLTEESIKPVYQSFGDSAESLKDGKIDAAFIVAGAPTTAIVDLATAGNVYLVSLDETHTAQLLQSSPYYSEAVIAADTYAGK